MSRADELRTALRSDGIVVRRIGATNRLTFGVCITKLHDTGTVFPIHGEAVGGGKFARGEDWKLRFC